MEFLPLVKFSTILRQQNDVLVTRDLYADRCSLHNLLVCRYNLIAIVATVVTHVQPNSVRGET